MGEDDESSSESDDLVTEYTYTAAPSQEGDPPAGLSKPSPILWAASTEFE